MKPLPLRRSAVGLALGALAASGLASGFSPAHAVISNGEISTNTYFSENSSDCTPTTQTPNPSDVAFTDNGVAAVQSHAVAGTSTNGLVSGDITDVSASSTMTITATPIGTGPATITGTAAVSARAVPRVASTGCGVQANGNVRAEGDFTLTQPMWMTISGSTSGDADIYLDASLDDGDLYLDFANRGSGSITAWVPAGPIYFTVTARASVYSTDAKTVESGNGTFAINLQPVGAATALSGKGQGYVQFGARNCADGSVAASLTTKAKKKAKKIVVKVNGAKAAKFKGKKKLKAKAFTLPAAPMAETAVSATVKLKNGKKATVTRSYLAC